MKTATVSLVVISQVHTVQEIVATVAVRQIYSCISSFIKMWCAVWLFPETHETFLADQKSFTSSMISWRQCSAGVDSHVLPFHEAVNQSAPSFHKTHETRKISLASRDRY